jgi:hypothetical protein
LIKARPADAAEEILLALASRMDFDGGMPGKNPESRASATVIALLAFLCKATAFRWHVARLVSYLKSLTGLFSHQQRIVAAIIELAQKRHGASRRMDCPHYREPLEGSRKSGAALVRVSSISRELMGRTTRFARIRRVDRKGLV